MKNVIVGGLAVLIFLGLAHYRPPADTDDNRAGLILPLPADLLLLAGDRYLTANINFFRAATVPYEAPNSLASRAILHRRVALLHPKHEDNYYFSSGGLSWMGDMTSGQVVLARAAKARYWDPLPYFFQGANEVYFNRDFIEGARLVALAADVTQGKNKGFFTNLSAKLYSRSEDLDVAVRYIKLLAANNSSEQLRHVLLLRAERLVVLKVLRMAAIKYEAIYGQVLTSLNSLVETKILELLPVDPMGIGYELNEQGLPILSKGK